MISASPFAKPKPMLDEGSFQQLLAAAYVVQQHNDSLWARKPQISTARLLSEIAELQSMLELSALDVSTLGKKISERLLEITAATGVSLSLISDGFLDCIAEAGVPVKIPGSSVASHSLVATERLKSGDVFESSDARRDMRLDGGICSSLGIGALVAAPVVRAGHLAGLIEVRWARARAFDETGLLACRLIASLAGEILEGRRSGQKSSPVFQPAPPKEEFQPAGISDLPGTESSGVADEVVLQPGEPEPVATAVPVDTQPAKLEVVHTDPEVDVVGTAAPAPEASEATETQLGPSYAVFPEVESCRVCGRAFGADEAFCGHCSMPRVASKPSQQMQSKFASLWFMGKAKEALAEENAEARQSSPAFSEKAMVSAVSATSETAPPEFAPADTDVRQAPRSDHVSYFEPTPAERNYASEVQFWERAATAASASQSSFHKIRGKDALLGLLAVVLAVGVISAWPRSNGQLTWFQSMLVRGGMARHSVPGFAGNPAIRVWVDQRTSSYYCPGSEPYGNTPAGYYTTQLEAEQAHSQPASGLVCQ